jgi:glycosyltransferase involved in cell wall biosynthesis
MPANIAVVMSVYGRDDPELFERALTSIEQQDYSDAPVRIYLCIDGPVPPGISKIIAGHQIYKKVHNETNLGLARSLNKLLDVLEDEDFVFRMDSDDYSHVHRVSSQVEAMRRRPEVDILGGSINEVDRSGSIVKTVHYAEDRAEILRSITWRSPVAHVTVCFRRRAIERFRHYPEVPVGQDWALWFKCLELGLSISNVRSVMVDVTISEHFFDRRGPKRAWEEFRIVTRGIHRTHGLTWRYVHAVLRLFFRLMPRALVKRLYASRLR